MKAARGKSQPDGDDAQEDQRYSVPALKRGLNLLMLFSRHEPVLSGAEIARRMALPRASVFRMLHTLESMGFVERVGQGASYRLGMAVLRLGFEYLASLEMTDIARPLLESLRDRTGCSAHLVVRDGREVVLIAKAAAQASLFHAIQVGARLPAHATALGRVLLGDLDHDGLAELFGATPLQPYSPSTPTDIASLERRIAEDRRRGHAISEGAFEPGVSTIAAPVFGDAGRLVAAVSITATTAPLAAACRDPWIEAVRSTARDLSGRLTREGGRERLAA